MGWYADDLSFVKDFTEYYSTSEKFKIDIYRKTSTDVPVRGDTISETYWKHLRECLNLFSKKYEYSVFHEIGMSQNANLQYYKPNEGFKLWHFEKGNDKIESMRNLVFMTYLNDVPDGGTEFLYQNLKVKAEKGLTLIWPAEWTHVHRGEISTTNNKFIITGWLNNKLMETYENRNLLGRPS
jgi:hypothetical protein